MIPHHFHFVFGLRPQTEPFHLMHYLCLASCIEVNRPDAIFFHYHEEPWGPWWERIRPRLELRRIEPDAAIAGFRYDDPCVGKFRYAHLSDFSRLEILLAEGGIYADIDSIFVEPLPAAWRERRFILGREKAAEGEAHGSLCNAWIASEPGAEFAAIWLEGMRSVFNGEWNRHSTLLPARLAAEYPDLLHIEDEEAFFSIDWTPKGIDDLFVRSVPVSPRARSLHLWEHLWADAGRLDFSAFHAGLLTPEYVALADTTYAKLARPHLPPDLSVSRAAWTLQRLRAGVEAPLRRAAARLGARR